MRLQARFVLIAGAITTVISLSIGYFAISTAFNSEITRVDNIIETVSTQLDARDPLSSAVFLAEESDAELLVALLDSSGQLVTVRTSAEGKTFDATSSQLKNNLVGISTIGEDEKYRVKTIQLPQSSFLILAIPIRDIYDNRLSNYERLGLFLAIALAIAFFATRVLIRPDMKKIERLASRAREIAQGRTWDVAVIERGNSEVDDLSKALNQMATYLQGALEGERRNSLKMQEFIGDASHELRTPLTVIKGYVELLGNANELDDEGKKRALDRLTSEITRMERLIADLLLLAEIGEKRSVLDDAVNISDLLRIQLTDLKLLETERKIEDSITPEVYIVGHLPHVQQLFANIFSNIRRHTPTGAPLYAHLDYVDNGMGKGVRIRIGDGGPGLPEEAYHKGVQQFQRFDGSRSRESGGSGLGISIMRAIVSEHRGNMELRKSKFGGLEIDIFFPLIEI